MTDYAIYITYIGNGTYQTFIKNNASKADFIRIIIGYTEIIHGKRVGKVSRSWIISPLKSSDEPVFIQGVNQLLMRGRRMWIAFESMKRHKPKAIPLGSFVALSTITSKWRTTVGSSTHFDIKSIDSIKSLENPLQLEQKL